MKAIIATIAALGMAACAAAAPEGARQTLVGKLRITGNDPFPIVMLQTDKDGTWELAGVSLADARGLAGQRVRAEGTVLQAPGPNVWLPSLRVDATPQPVSR